MSLRLPPVSSPARAHVDVAFLVEITTDSAKLRSLGNFRDTLRKGREFLAAEPAAKSVALYALRADGSLWLVRVTRRAWSRMWNFGKV